jgi:short-subunit dehydrogenase
MMTWEPFSALDASTVRAQLCCNVVAPMLLAHLVLPDMLRRRAGTILNISSACVAQRGSKMTTLALKTQLTKHVRVSVVTCVHAGSASSRCPTSRCTPPPRRR